MADCRKIGVLAKRQAQRREQEQVLAVPLVFPDPKDGVLFFFVAQHQQNQAGLGNNRFIRVDVQNV